LSLPIAIVYAGDGKNQKRLIQKITPIFIKIICHEKIVT